MQWIIEQGTKLDEDFTFDLNMHDHITFYFKDDELRMMFLIRYGFNNGN